jgi:hypothetical protein
VVGLELRNVGANYPFEKSRRFPAIQPNLVTGDGSRLSCGVADTAILDPRLYPLVIGERVRDKIAKTQLDVRPMSWPPSVASGQETADNRLSRFFHLATVVVTASSAGLPSSN